jgi:hypothetical protein
VTTPQSPAWLKIYRFFAETPPPVGSLITHDSLARTAGLDFANDRHRSQYYHAVATASAELETEKSRTLLTERGSGYRYVAGNLHAEKAVIAANAIRRRLIRTAGTAATVDTAGLSPAEVARVEQIQSAILTEAERFGTIHFPPPPYAPPPAPAPARPAPPPAPQRPR